MTTRLERQPHRVYGHRPSPPDERDYLANPAGLSLAPEVDMRKGPMPLVFDQLELGSCTANGTGAMLQYDLSLDRLALGQSKARRRSRLDLYYGERSIEGTLGRGDVGAVGRDGFKYAQQTGVLLESAWPYDISRYQDTPPDLKRHKLTKPYALVDPDVDTMKAVLSNNQMIGFGFTVYSSFESQNTAYTGIVQMPAVGYEEELGGHWVVACGYLANEPDYALVRNSWSSKWGIGGYCLFPWQYLVSTSLVSERRTIVRPA